MKIYKNVGEERAEYHEYVKKVLEDSSNKAMLTKKESLVDVLKRAILKSADELAGKPFFPEKKVYFDLLNMLGNAMVIDISYASFIKRDIFESVLPKIFPQYVQDLAHFCPEEKDRWDAFEKAVILAVHDDEVKCAINNYQSRRCYDPSPEEWAAWQKKSKGAQAGQQVKGLWQRIKEALSEKKGPEDS